MTKEILNKIKPSELSADFNGFTYQDLAHALEWVNEFIKESEKKDITEEKRKKQLLMQKILHEGAIRKWEAEHKPK